ncbi:uncharacterized protein [Zea mays]|uniref:uncharacterized protein n=1 Tax=Zea mays TaxID=4577 RepID=UPI000C6C3E6D|nr:uncharacterized protein LOC111591341 [Zea mays]|eukprot:XP_023158072.1 uncharacterized protein LOC111591341 [Zea mays]
MPSATPAISAPSGTSGGGGGSCNPRKFFIGWLPGHHRCFVEVADEFIKVDISGVNKRVIRLSNVRKSELYAPLNAELLLELHHKAGDDCESRVGSNTTEQQEAIEAWRVGKLKDMRSTSSKNLSNFGLSSEDSRMLKRALEFNWQMLLEDIGLWIPPTIYHIEHDDKPENEPEDEEIIPGPPLPPECNTELHTDYGGTAVRWGLTHHKESVADCCQACIDQAKMARPGALKCNIWVYCPSEYGCYSPDKYEHKHQECWLKQADHPRLNFKDRYPKPYRDSHPTAPVVVPWMSGVITAM